MAVRRKARLYEDGVPCENFNQRIKSWLDMTETIKEHTTPKAFESLRQLYTQNLDELLLISEDPNDGWSAHRHLLSNLTDVMYGIDIAVELATRLSPDSINSSGFRTALSQGAAKNTGENFINIIVYILADLLSYQDEVLVVKGLPPMLREPLTLRRTFTDKNGVMREIKMPIEGDLCIFSRSNPLNAIVVNAKTRLKEIFHIGTMWKLFFDMVDDDYLLNKWGLRKDPNLTTALSTNMQYIFITADMIKTDGTNTQGGDVEREDVRNLIAMDASFFDYVFVSKQNISHVANSIEISSGREALFHELGCLLDMIKQKYNI
ncbi:hypothetical protein ASG65_19110 [Bacillus sp. Leaf13]|nr:hypothetical protein ASG65_19110 [Bacillus sp. Leaf13]